MNDLIVANEKATGM